MVLGLITGLARDSSPRIATNSFELKEVEVLNDIMKYNYNLKKNILKIWRIEQYSIYITEQSVHHLRNILEQFLQSSILYKLRIDNTESSSFKPHTYI